MRALGIALVLLGCGPDFERPSVVNKLRILAVRLDPAAVELEENATITLTPLIADPFGAGRAITYSWSPCVTVTGTGAMPSVDFRFPADCADADDLLVMGEDPTLDYAVPPEFAMLAGYEDFIGQSGSVGIPVRLIVEAGDERQIAIVPVAVVPPADPVNRNPDFATLDIGATELAVGDAIDLRATWDEEAAETYSYVAGGSGQQVETQEVIAVNWFSSIGEIDPDVTSDDHLDTKLKLPDPPPEGIDPHLWAVISDGRGGVSWRDIPLTTP